MAQDSLLHITDLHFSEVVTNPFQLLNKRLLGNLNVWLRRRHEFVTDRADAFSEYVAASGVGQVLMTGDFSSTATEAECAAGAAFARGLEARGLELFAIPGNHDVYTFESVRKARFERHFKPWIAQEGLPAVRTLPGGTSLVLVPTVCPNLLSSKGRISPKEIQAVATRLATCSSPIIVGGHYPVLSVTHVYSTRPSRRLRNAEALREVLGASGKTILYVSGHVHRFSFAQDDRYPKLSHLSSGAFFRSGSAGGVKGEFSEICVSACEFSVIRHVFGTDWTSSKEVRHDL